MAKRAFALLAVLVLAMSLVACGGSKLVGTWEATSNGLAVGYTFEKDGTCKANLLGLTLEGTYKTEGDNLTITMSFLGQESTDTTKYKVEGDKLTMTSTTADGEKEEIVLTKK